MSGKVSGEHTYVHLKFLWIENKEHLFDLVIIFFLLSHCLCTHLHYHTTMIFGCMFFATKIFYLIFVLNVNHSNIAPQIALFKVNCINTCLEHNWAFVLTAGNVQIAGLLVEGEEGQVHWAGAGERDSDTVQDISIGEDSDVQIGLWMKKNDF